MMIGDDDDGDDGGEYQKPNHLWLTIVYSSVYSEGIIVDTRVIVWDLVTPKCDKSVSVSTAPVTIAP